MTESESGACGLSPEASQYAAANSKEFESERVAQIRRWIDESADLNAPTDDFFILRFLRACKYDMERTRQKLRNFHQLRTSTPEWYANRDPFLAEMQEMFDLGICLPLKKPDEQGRMVVIIRTSAHDPSKHKLADVLKAALMVLDVSLRDNEHVTRHGIVAILNMEGVGLGHAIQLQPNVVKRLVHSWQGCYPLRIKSLDFVNAPVYVNVVLRIFKGFMTPKLRQRLRVHRRDMSAVLHGMPPDILPADYGGAGETIRQLTDYWKKKVEENHAWLADDEKYKVIPPE